MSEITRIVIAGESGWGPEEEAWTDCVTIGAECLSYEYAPRVESDINPHRAWSYTTTSPVFTKQFRIICDLAELAVGTEPSMRALDVPPVSIAVEYADGARQEKVFCVPEDYFTGLFRQIKSLVPPAEYTPAVLLTSEDFEDFDLEDGCVSAETAFAALAAEPPMKFVASFSCGKDSTYALAQMVSAGHTPVAIITSCNLNTQRAMFHGADADMLDAYADALGVPCIKTFTDGSDYDQRFEEGLLEAKKLGATAVCFGDVALDSSKKWNESRAAAVGLRPVMPLWNRDRESYVQELLDAGYKCLIKVVDLDVLPEDLLGKVLDDGILTIMRSRGADVCGENGEFHTLVIDGPVFKHPLPFVTGGSGVSGHCAWIETTLA